MMDKLLQDLSSFDPAARRAALAALARQPAPAGPATDWVNMHMHSFFSFNGEGFAPERLAWEARRAGLYAAAVCDFDVLEGAASFLAAAASLGLRAAAGFESRVFFTEYASREINSPGEPGVFYFMGMGFVRPPAPETAAGKVLARMLALSHERNRAAIARVNAALGDPCLDYERDVLPLTPAGNATERHIVRSYYELALRARGGLEPALRWWAAKFNLDPAGLLQNAGDINKTLEVLRAKLFKQGGIGYVQPTPQMFPVLDEVIGMIRQCGAIPMSAWLDGLSAGEADPGAQLDCLMAKGVAAVNIIPDRNWNIKDQTEKELKVAALNRYVAAARNRGLPINVGTELNKPGQRFVDDFASAALAPHHAAFLEGARIMVGHTLLLDYADFPYTGPAAAAEFADIAARNRFFAAVGALPAPTLEMRAKLRSLGSRQAYSCLCDAARAGAWPAA